MASLAYPLGCLQQPVCIRHAAAMTRVARAAVWVCALAAKVRRAPVSFSVGVSAVVSLALFLWSFWPVVPLAHRPGFLEAARFLDAHASSGTFVVVWPPHFASALDALPPGLQAADAVPQEEPGNRRYTQLWLVGPRGFSSPPELASLPAPRRQSFGDVELAAFRYPDKTRVLFDLRRDLASTVVRLEGGAKTLACDQPLAPGGWACPGRPSWNRVYPVTLTAAGQPYASVWAHPVSRRTLVLDLGERTLGSRIELQAALDDRALARGAADVQVVLEVGDQSFSLLRSNQRGIAELAVPTEPGSTRIVRLRISTANDGRRHLGVNLRLLTEAQL